MRGFFGFWLWAAPVLLLVSYLTAAVVNGGEMALELRSLDGETCLPAILFLEIGPEHELENVKAQAVIARSNLYRKIQEGETLGNILGETGEKIRERGISSMMRQFMEKEGLYHKAVEDTAGQVLTYGGRLCLAPYHEISCGQTRDGAEAFHSQEYGYLVSVESQEDKRAKDYFSSRYGGQGQLPEGLKIREKDSAGYVTLLEAEGYLLEGETFAQGMSLASSCFTIQKTGNRYRFLSRGKGHGLGFSQYGGNQLAKEGRSWREILAVYFPKMEQQGVEELKKREES